MAAPFTVLIMAAGQGTRMLSDTPKVLHRVAGKPLVEWVADAARAAGAERVVAIVRPGDGVEEGLPDGIEVAEQREGEGTGAAVLAARDACWRGRGAGRSRRGPVRRPPADHAPSSSRGSSTSTSAQDARATLLTTDQLDPTGYGRIVRDSDGTVDRIYETKYTDGLTPEELAVREINLGAYVFDPQTLFDALDNVGLEQGERYLTGVFPLIRERRRDNCRSHDRRRRRSTGHQRPRGPDGGRGGRPAPDHRGPRPLGCDLPSAGNHQGGGRGDDRPRHHDRARARSSRAATVIGERCEIGPHTTLRGATIGDGATVVHSFVLEAEVGADAKVGPFAYLRPGTVIGEGAKVGTFVEIKNSDIGARAKVPHLSYIGDADVGEDSNLGASTITANYDGRKKHRTKLGKSVKTGIHTSLVAPLDVGDRAYTGAGSTINEDVPDGALGIGRAKQKNIEGYADRVEEDSQK